MMRRAGRTRQPGTSEAQEFSGLPFSVYARKANLGRPSRRSRSTARQIEQARRYVEAKDSEVLSDPLYVDENTSGAKFKSCPGLLCLLNALENGYPRNAVVMSDDDRLGREQFETGY